MEAPVPASALIHSATLVSAGVFLILRFNYIFYLTEYSKLIIPIVGSMTAAYGGLCASAQSDIKKALAYSTISHCGFLMVLCSTGMNEFTIIYLYVHGFFKAGVFMCVGNILRITRGYQDTRRMGNLLKYLPFEYFCVTVGVLNLAGLPFTFGFFIKHLLLLNLGDYMYIYMFVMAHCFVGAFSGLFYSFKIIYYTFNDFKKGHNILYSNLNKVNYNYRGNRPIIPVASYTNSTSGSILSILGLFSAAYVITYFMIRYFMSSHKVFSEYMNLIVLSNYYVTITTFNGFLLNFSYVNTTVIFIVLSLLFSKFRKATKFYLVIQMLYILFSLVLFYFYFYYII